MKKYEILNNKWIRKTDKHLNNSFGYTAIKIELINTIITTVPRHSEDNTPYRIYFQGGQGCDLVFEYSNLEFDMYKSDLNYFEDLIINR